MPVTEDFQGLKVEVSVHADGLKGLSGELCGQILAGLMKVLREEPALESLQEEVSSLLEWAGWVGPAPGPSGSPAPPYVPSWNRACAVGGWRPLMPRGVPSWSAWCSPLER